MSSELDFSDAVYYHADQFPPNNLNYERLFQAVGNARAALGRYDQMLKTLHDSEILLAPLRRQEAITSSRMEGTISTIDELLRVEAEDDFNDTTDLTRHRTEAIEVYLYHRAMREAQASIEKGHPLSAWLIRSSHRILLSFGRGASKTPGEFKTNPNYLYDETSRRVRFVPIDPGHLPQAFEQLEAWISRSDIEPLIQAAIAHVEFEALHPFNDGNGRIGRMIIPLMLWQRELISVPHLYISRALEDRREEYIQRMRNVSRSDEWTEWCLFFLEALCIQIDQNLRVSAQILELYEEMKIRFREVLSSQWLMQALDFMFANPMFRNSRFVKFSGIPKPTARRMTRLLAENDLLRTVIPASGRRPAMYAFEPLLEIVRI